MKERFPQGFISRNFANEKFRENKTLAKILKFTVLYKVLTQYTHTCYLSTGIVCIGNTLS